MWLKVTRALAVLSAVLPVHLGAAAAAQAASDPREIIIFTDRDPRFVEFLISVFSVEYHVTPIVHYGDGEDLNIWRRKDPDFAPDVVLTTDAAWLDRYAREGGVEASQSEILFERVPEMMRDPRGLWFGLTQRARAFHVAADRVADGEISTYEELADPAWRGRICSRSLEHPDSIRLIAAMINRYGPTAARTWLSGFRANLAQPPEGDDRAQIRAVSEGVCDVAIANTDVRGLMSETGAEKDYVADTRMVIPTFSDNSTHVTLMAAAVHAKAPNPGEAVAFIEFLASDKGQRMLMKLSYEHPVAKGVDLEGLVARWGEVEPEEITISWLDYLTQDARAMAMQPANGEN